MKQTVSTLWEAVYGMRATFCAAISWLLNNDRFYAGTQAPYKHGKQLGGIRNRRRRYIYLMPLCVDSRRPSVFLLSIKASLDESSFEVVDMEFLRSSTYLTFFDYLDKKGGIFYEVRGVTFWTPRVLVTEFYFTRSDGTVRQYWALLCLYFCLRRGYSSKIASDTVMPTFNIARKEMHTGIGAVHVIPRRILVRKFPFDYTMW